MEQHWEENEEARVEKNQVIFIDDKYEKFGSRKNASEKNPPPSWKMSPRKIIPRKLLPSSHHEFFYEILLSLMLFSWKLLSVSKIYFHSMYLFD